MHSFKEFGIKPNTNNFVGEKIQIQRVLNQSIKVLSFKISPSKQKANTELLTLQIEKSGDKRVIFTGSSVLIDQIKQVPREGFPFETIIKKDNEYYEFT